MFFCLYLSFSWIFANQSSQPKTEYSKLYNQLKQNPNNAELSVNYQINHDKKDDNKISMVLENSGHALTRK